MGALQFVNDPILAPGERAPFAERSHAGEVMGWDPKVGSTETLVEFLGGGHVVVNGKVYWESGNGTLTPVDGQDRAGVFVRWLSSMPGYYSAEWARSAGCIVRADGGADLEAVQAAATIQAQGIADLQAELVEAMREIADRDARIAELEADLAHYLAPKYEQIAADVAAGKTVPLAEVLSPDADTAAAPTPKPARSKQAK